MTATSLTRDGKPSIRFGHRGLHFVSLGGGSQPMLAKLYGADNRLIASLTEKRGNCIDPGYVDFFLGPNCRPAVWTTYLVEIDSNGKEGILHDNPKALAADRDGWLSFLDAWITRHGA